MYVNIYVCVCMYVMYVCVCVYTHLKSMGMFFLLKISSIAAYFKLEMCM